MHKSKKKKKGTIFMDPLFYLNYEKCIKLYWLDFAYHKRVGYKMPLF